MKANIELDIAPLNVQDHVLIKHKGPLPAPNAIAPTTLAIASLHVRNLDSVTLGKLCDDFTDAMFTAARLERPPEAIGPPEKEDLTLNMQWLKGDLFVNGVVISNVYGGDSRYVGSVMLPNPPTYKSVFTTESKARKEMERVVMAWFERVTGESYV